MKSRIKIEMLVGKMVTNLQFRERVLQVPLTTLTTASLSPTEVNLLITQFKKVTASQVEAINKESPTGAWLS